MTQTTLEETYPDGTQARTRQRAALNKSRYTSTDSVAREWDTVWTRSWLFAGLVSDLEDPGDYFLYNIGRESIVIVRQSDDDIVAFYNVCQHRGNRIFTGSNDCFVGHVKEVTCPYHGWRYGLDGSLLSIPDEERFAPPVDKAQRSLQTIRHHVWAGMVWLCMDEQAPSFSDFLGPVLRKLTAYPFEKMQLAKHQTVLIEANWKTVRDNFLEQYHVDFIHPQHASLVDCCNSTNILWPHGHSATMVEGYVTDSRYPEPQETPPHLEELLRGLGLTPEDFNGRVSDIRQAVQRQKRQLGPELGFDYSSLSDEQVSDVWQFDLFPNTFMTIQAEELWIYGPRPHPTDPNKCFFDKWTLQLPTEIATDIERGLTLNPSLVASREDERPDHAVFTADDVIAGEHTLTITLDQDIYLLADMQAGMHSRGFRSAVLNQDEVRVQHFHDWIDRCFEDNTSQSS